MLGSGQEADLARSDPRKELHGQYAKSQRFGPQASYTAVMTRALDAAIAKLAALPPEEQDRVGRWLLDELADDEQWTRRF
jgi:hypothetical protein